MEVFLIILGITAGLSLNGGMFLSPIFILIGFGFLGHAVRDARRATRVASWPTTQGALTNVALTEHEDEGTTYEVEVKYAYTVAGNTYIGS